MGFGMVADYEPFLTPIQLSTLTVSSYIESAYSFYFVYILHSSSYFFVRVVGGGENCGINSVFDYQSSSPSSSTYVVCVGGGEVGA